MVGWSATRKLRHFEALKGNRRSFTAFRMTLLWLEVEGAGRAFRLYRRLLGSYATLKLSKATADPSLRSG